jgi:alginate O-acetyltransferase complex protein AlgJ
MNMQKSGLLKSYRKYWFVIALALLTVPMLIQTIQPRETISERELRSLAPRPVWPQSLTEIAAWPRTVDKFLADHFGLRDSLVRANAILRYVLVSPTDLRVIYGRARQLYFDGDAMMLQSMGLVQRQDEIDAFADFAAKLHARLLATDTQFLVTIAPNSATILRDKLPAWAKIRNRPTEYRRMLAALTKRNVPVLDMRPALVSAQAEKPVYRRTDTHWNNFGALAGYNAVVQTLGKFDWVIAPDKVFRGFEPVPGGDLARMLGISADTTDRQAQIDLSPYGPLRLAITPIDTGAPTGGDLVETGRPGPTVMVLGDSFTRYYWQDYFGLHAGRYIWIHGELCAFRPELIERYRPDIVVLAPTERFMFCWNL